MELIILVILAAFFLIPLLMFIIKTAVKEGILEAYDIIRKEENDRKESD